MTFVVACLALFGAGLTATLSPCVLPLVPGYLAVLADGAGGRGVRVLRVSTFAAGAVMVFAALGALVGTLGSDLGDAGRWVQQVAGVALVVLAVLFVLGRTGGVHRELRLVRWLPASPQWRAFALGAGCGAAWTPCAGPLLGAALTAAGGAGGVTRSTVLLVAYATGVLAPFVALAAVGTRRVPGWMRRFGRVLVPVGTVVMAGLGVVLAAGWYETLVGRAGLR